MALNMAFVKQQKLPNLPFCFLLWDFVNIINILFRPRDITYWVITKCDFSYGVRLRTFPHCLSWPLKEQFGAGLCLRIKDPLLHTTKPCSETCKARPKLARFCNM
jgi:hypothetical protein